MSDFTPVPAKTVAYIGPAGGVHEAIVCRVNGDRTINLVYVDILDGEDAHGLNRCELAGVPPITENWRRGCFAKDAETAEKLRDRFDKAVQTRQKADQKAAQKRRAKVRKTS